MLTYPMQLVQIAQDFLEKGGPVLQVLVVVMLIMWILIIERILFIKFNVDERIVKAIEQWSTREIKDDWFALRVRELMMSQFRMALNNTVPVIKALVVVCPLLGLLGTVSGMIGVFDVMAISGTGDARSMASGISKATIPTMAGMVAALTGIFFSSKLQSMIDDKVNLMAMKLD